MDQKEYNIEINRHIGALKGIDETIPKCDKPCNVHEAYAKKQEHQIAISGLTAQYIGNGMSSDIAAKIAPVVVNTIKTNFPPILTTEEIVNKLTPIIVETIHQNLATTPKPNSESIKMEPKIYQIYFPGTSKFIQFTRDKLLTWGFNLIILLFLTWLSTGKLDKTTLRSITKEILIEETKGMTNLHHQIQSTNIVVKSVN